MNPSLNNKMNRIAVLDYARFSAAMMLVIYHYLFYGIKSHTVSTMLLIPYVSDVTKYGYFGVHLFFMISGYVIFFSAEGRRFSQFITARILRLYPAFLFGVLCTSFVIYFWGGDVFTLHLSQFLTNLVMFPTIFGRKYVDGSCWTLTHEYVFYGIVSLFLLFGNSNRLKIFFIIWPFLILSAGLAGGAGWYAVGGFYSFFAAGALFAMLRSHDNSLVRIMLVVSFYNSLQFTINTLSSPLLEPHNLSPLVVTGLISGFYLFFCVLNRESVLSLSLPLAQTLGALTFPIYLLHQNIGYIIFNYFGNQINQLALVGMTVAFMLVFAYIVHLVVERRMANFWKSIIGYFIGKPLRVIETVAMSRENAKRV